MRLDKFTTKFQEALSDAQSIALGNDHAYIEPVHMLVAMLKQDDGPKALLQRAGANVPGLLAAAEAAVKRLPQVQGNDQVQGGPELGRVLQATEKEAIKRGDQFIASELFLLAVIDSKGEAAKIAKDNGLTRKSLEAAIEAVRGGQKMDSAEAEGQRGALAKYCLDLTERARMGKLDPVIGRDDALREPLDDGGLADAGLADEHGVVLGPTGQYLADAADLAVASDDGVELALPGAVGEVDPELLERALLLLLPGQGLCVHSFS